MAQMYLLSNDASKFLSMYCFHLAISIFLDKAVWLYYYYYYHLLEMTRVLTTNAPDKTQKMEKEKKEVDG